MTTPPHQPGPYGQPSQDPYGQGGGYGQYGPPAPPQQPQYGGWPQYGGQYGGQYGSDNERTQQFGGGQQWPGAGYGGAEPPEPPRRKTGKVVAFVVAAVLVLAGAGAGIYLATKDDGGSGVAGGTTTTAPDKTGESSEPGTTTETTSEEPPAEPGEAIDAQPGECIKVNVASSTSADVETVDCSTPEAVYRIATREETDAGSCPNEQYVSYTEEDQLLLCLQLNVVEGECLQVTDIEDKRTDCASPDATHKVIGVLTGVDDETRCAEATTEVLTYPEPALTICLGEPVS